MFSWSFTMRITLWEAYQRCLCSEFSLVVVHFHTSICAQYELFVYRRCGALRAWSRGHYACFSDCRMVILQRHLFEGRRRPSPIGFAIPIWWLDITRPRSSSALEDEDLDFLGCVSCFLLFIYLLLSMFFVRSSSVHLSMCSLCKLVSPASSLTCIDGR